jgi:hypothetical protein
VQDADYLRHLKPLGKFCYMYDTAGDQASVLDLGLARTVDQVGTGEIESLPGVLITSRYVDQINSAILAGPTALQSVITSLAAAYLTDADFRGDLEDNTPDNPNDVVSVLNAFALELTGDGKKLDVEDTVGFVNFFHNVLGATEVFPTDVSPTYADATYVVAAIV